MRMRSLASLVVLVGTSLTVVATGPAAEAHRAVRTSTGVRCTIVGTRGPDRLHGTPGRDVICGLGGNDVITGLGGDDVIDGGRGDDRISGGAGRDKLYGGAGDDSLDGQGGDDTLRGSAGDDQIVGDGGDDRAYGEDGDDDLTGGEGGDALDGGAGFNVCDSPRSAGDTQVNCAIDAAAPVVQSVTASPSTVDVSAAAQRVKLQAHVTDDTGVARVQIASGIARLVSGTPRDGVWATTIQVPRFIEPGPRSVDVFAHDRVGRMSLSPPFGPTTYTVIDSVVDQAMPVVQSLALSTGSVDVRASAQSISASVHLTDDLAGASTVYLCAAHAFPSGSPGFRQDGACSTLRQTAGSPTDATWSGSYTVPKGAPSGTWNFEVWVEDASGNRPNDFWMGPDQYAANAAYPDARLRQLPAGQGVFTVVGSAQDVSAPVLTGLSIQPGAVDTAHGAVQVTADVAGTDVEGITDAGLFISGWAGYPDNPNVTDTVQVAWVQHATRVSGTPQNGVWQMTFVVPGGTPDGEYFIQAALQDSSHFESWVSPDSGWTTNNHVLTPELAPTGVRFVVSNS